MKQKPRVLATVEITVDDILAAIAGAVIAGIFVGWLILDAGRHV